MFLVCLFILWFIEHICPPITPVFGQCLYCTLMLQPNSVNKNSWTSFPIFLQRKHLVSSSLMVTMKAWFAESLVLLHMGAKWWHRFGTVYLLWTRQIPIPLHDCCACFLLSVSLKALGHFWLGLMIQVKVTKIKNATKFLFSEGTMAFHEFSYFDFNRTKTLNSMQNIKPYNFSCYELNFSRSL